MRYEHGLESQWRPVPAVRLCTGAWELMHNKSKTLWTWLPTQKLHNTSMGIISVVWFTGIVDGEVFRNQTHGCTSFQRFPSETPRKYSIATVYRSMVDRQCRVLLY